MHVKIVLDMKEDNKYLLKEVMMLNQPQAEENYVIYVELSQNFWSDFFVNLKKFDVMDHMSIVNGVIDLFLQQNHLDFLDSIMNDYGCFDKGKISICPFYVLFESFGINSWLYKNISDSLFCLADKEYYGVVKYLFNKVEAVDVTDNRVGTISKGYTLLFFALYQNNISMVEWFLIKGCDANKKNSYGDTPLIVAIRKRLFGAVDVLMQNGANLDARNNDDIPLFMALEKKDFKLVNLLLERGANVTEKKSNGNTLLLEVISAEYLSMEERFSLVENLIKYGSDVNAKNIVGNTPLFEAISGGYLQIISCLINEGAYIDEKNKEGYTPLFFATKTGCLLKVKANVDKKNKENNALSFFKDSQTFKEIDLTSECISLLIVKKANIHFVDQNGLTMLHLAVLRRDEEALVIFLSNNLDINIQDNNKRTPLHLASENGFLDIVEMLLLNKKVNINCRDCQNNTPLYLALLQKHLDVAKYLLEQNASVLLRDSMGRNILHFGVLAQDFNVFQQLITRIYDLEKGFFIDVNAVDNKGETALHYAIKLMGSMSNDDLKFNDMCNIIRTLLELGASPEQIRDKEGLTPLHLASKKGLLDIVKMLLLNKEVNIDSQDNEHNTPLCLAFLQRNLEVVEYLIKRGASILKKDSIGRNILHFGVLTQNFSFFQQLITLIFAPEKDCVINVDAVDHKGETALHYAIKLMGAMSNDDLKFNDMYNIIRALLELGASPEKIRDKEGVTPKDIALHNKRQDILSLMLKKGDDLIEHKTGLYM